MSNLNLGIVGLPNVGKSTLFNALTNKSVPAENYPFCTIDPNVGIVEVEDPLFYQLVETVKPDSVKPAVIQFVDIAGIVEGAHKGEGLGNAFLANIREVDAIIHVLRYFKNEKITHVYNNIDPKHDQEIIESELIFKDLETINKQIQTLSKEVRTDVEKMPLLEFLHSLEKHLDSGKTARTFIAEETKIIKEYRKGLFLLTDKPMIYIVNVDWLNPDISELKEIRDKLKIGSSLPILPINIAQEFELSNLNDLEARELEEELGLEGNGLAELTRIGYRVLDLLSYYTAGKQEVRAWTIKEGTNAQEAAAKIHTDISDNFISTEVANIDEFIKLGGWQALKDSGKVRLEGRDYIVNRGDVMYFIHN